LDVNLEVIKKEKLIDIAEDAVAEVDVIEE
jgi:hypothetical protein